MGNDTITIWIRIISVFILFMAAMEIVFFVMTVNGVIDGTYADMEALHFYLDTPMSLAVFVGLWRLKRWGWKSAVIFIPLSWIVCLFGLFVDYGWGVGLITAPFMVIDAVILNYLFKPQVCLFFQIHSSPLLRLKATVPALLLLALFLAVMDIFGGLVAFVTAVVVSFALVKARKTVNKLRSSEGPIG